MPRRPSGGCTNSVLARHEARASGVASRRLVSLALLVMAQLACAGPFSTIIVFGDSLSDVGMSLRATCLGLRPYPSPRPTSVGAFPMAPCGSKSWPMPWACSSPHRLMVARTLPWAGHKPATMFTTFFSRILA